MKAILSCLILAIISLSARSQHWAVAHIPLYPIEIRCMYTDSFNNSFYCSGNIFNTVYPSDSLSICKYDGNTWSIIGTFNANVMAVVSYHNELIVGGSFDHINQAPFNYIARYDSTLQQWVSLGNFNAAILRLKVLNGELYAMGDFTLIDGIPFYGLAKWNGLNWTDVNAFPYFNIHIITDITYYNGELYVAGNFYDQSLGIEDMAYYHNGTWQSVGQGFFGGFNSLSKLEVYNGELYAAGTINKSDGNVGNGIQKWDGTNWSEVGSSLQDANNSTILSVSVRDMVVNNGELYVSGNFSFAGHVPARELAKWNGSHWCGFGTSSEFTMHTLTLAFYQDTLYLNGGIDTLNGIFTNYLIKWIGGNYIDSCSAPLSLDESISLFVAVYPVPAFKTVNIQGEILNGRCKLYLIENSGQTVLEKEIFILNKNYQLDIENYVAGSYILKIVGKDFVYTFKLLIQ